MKENQKTVNNFFSGSIVLYKNNIGGLEKAILSLIKYNSCTSLYLIDNSPNNSLKRLQRISSRIFYIHNPLNPGFGSSHNFAIREAIELGAKYHFVINPDIEIEEDIFTPMIEYIQKHPEIGMMMPKVLNVDGSIQNLPKLLPNPFWILRRKLKKIDPFGIGFVNKYELRIMPKDQICNVPILSGCFSLLNLDAIKEIGMYDENFFMYFEDFDLSRRMHQKYRTIYFPDVSVIHGYEGGANKSYALLKIFIKSMFIYFNKWGWFFDKERKIINKRALAQFEH